MSKMMLEKGGINKTIKSFGDKRRKTLAMKTSSKD